MMKDENRELKIDKAIFSCGPSMLRDLLLILMRSKGFKMTDVILGIKNIYEDEKLVREIHGRNINVDCVNGIKDDMAKAFERLIDIDG